MGISYVHSTDTSVSKLDWGKKGGREGLWEREMEMEMEMEKIWDLVADFIYYY